MKVVVCAAEQLSVNEVMEPIYILLLLPLVVCYHCSAAPISDTRNSKSKAISNEFPSRNILYY